MRMKLAVCLLVLLAWPASAHAVGRWADAGTMHAIAQGATALTLQDGRVLVAPAYQFARPELFDPADNSWTEAEPIGGTRNFPVVVQLFDGTVLVAGGGGIPRRYDPATDSWSDAGTMSSSPSYAAGTLLEDGRVLVVGGYVSAAAQIYDPGSNSWSDADSLAIARGYTTATLLPGGRVLVAGGDDGARKRSTELYDPATDEWSPGPALADARSAHSATLLQSGKVLIAGGSGPDATILASAELFDPATDTISPGAPMPNARYDGGTVLLPSGEVLMAGGFGPGYNPRNQVETYDPGTDTWTAAPSLRHRRYSTAAAVLADGTVLVAGGMGPNVEELRAERSSLPTTAALVPGDFGDVVVGARSPVVYLPVSNTGAFPLFVDSASPAGTNPEDFAVVTDTCTGPDGLAPGRTCLVGVRFSPAAAGERTAELRLADDVSGGVEIVPLTGTGVAAPGGTPGPKGAARHRGREGRRGRARAEGDAGPQGIPGRAIQATCTKRGKKTTCNVVVLPDGDAAASSLSLRLTRGGKTFATGTARRAGRVRLVPRRRIRAGRYTLVVAVEVDGRIVRARTAVRLR